MDGILTLFTGLAQNVALLLSLVFVYGLLARRLERIRPGLRGVVIGAEFGVIALTGMLLRIHVAPGVNFDSRNVAVALAGVVGGGVSALTAAALAAAYRLWLGGVGAIPGVGAIVTAAVLGAWIHWRWGPRVREFGARHFLLLGAALAASGLLWTLTLPDPDFAWRMLKVFAFPVGVLYPLATMLAGRLLSYVQEERERITLSQFSIDHSPEAVLWADSTGRLSRVNDEASHLLGYSRKELGSLHVWDLDVNCSREAWPANWERLHGSSELGFESSYRARDGRLIPVGIVSALLEFEGMEYACAFVRDISQAKRLQEETERRRQAAEGLAEAARLALQSLDAEEIGQRVVDSICALIGARASALYRLEEETGDLVAVAVSGEEGPTFGVPIVFPKGTSAVGLAVRDGQPVVTPNFLTDPRITLTPEIRARVEQATYRSVLAVPLLVKGSVIGALGMGDREGRTFGREEIELAQAFADQVAIAIQNARLYEAAERRRRAAESLAEVERLISRSLDPEEVARKIVESVDTLLESKSSILLRLDPEGERFTVLAFSGEMERLFGRDAVFPAGTGAAGVAIRERRPVVTPDVLADPRITFTPEARGYAEQVAWRAVLAVPLLSRERVIGALSVARSTGRTFDPEEIRLAEALADQAAVALENSRLYGELRSALEELEASQRQIVETERLKALGELAGGVAHNFNNTLAIILGRVELLLARARSPEVRRQLRVIEETARDAARTVRRIDEFTRMRQARPFEAVDLNQVADAVVEFTRPRWKEEAEARGTSYEVRAVKAPVHPVTGDASELREALTNLVFNALDAMPDGGRIVFRTGMEGDRVCCAVSDTGIGMTEEVRQRVFDPFFTTKGERGSGLGLSVTYGIIARHGGEIDVRSQVGQGTTFTIRLPARQEAVEGPMKVPPPSVARTGKILVIDDEAELREILGELLAAQGHVVAVCADGEAGLSRLQAEAFDLVITDLGMPGLSGWDVVRRAKQCRPETPVALLTGWADQIDSEEAQAKGADFLMAKPFMPDDVQAVVARALARTPARD